MIEESKLPKGWEVKKLGEVCKLKNGFAFKSINYQSEGVPVIRISDINGGIVSTKDTVRVEKTEDYKNYLVEENDILIAMSGATTGKFGIFKGIEEAYQNQRVGNFKILDEKILNKQFLFYQINSLKRQIEKDAYGGAQPNISSTKIEKMQVVLPSPREQEKIVTKIEELFSQLENGKQQLLTAQKQLKTYRQSLLKSAFEGKLTNQNLKNGELSKGWEVQKLGDVCDVNPKLPNKDQINSELEIQFLPMRLVEELINKISLTETRSFIEVQKKSYTPFIDEDIIFAKVTPCMENGKIAVVRNLKNGIGFGSSEFHVVRCSKSILSKFVFYFLVRDKFRNEAASQMSGAVGLRRVPRQFIENYLVNIPPLLEQQAIVAILESKLTICDKIEETIKASLKQSEMLRQSILKKAFEGKLLTQKNLKNQEELQNLQN